jgi:predicted nucleic acid-binding protein
VAREQQPASSRLILDSGAVIGWSRGDPRVRALLREALTRDIEVTVPVIVLAETLRGGARDAPVNRVLKAVGSTPTHPSTGRRAGTLLGRTGGRNTADALVAAEVAAVPGSAVLTSDPDDLGALLAGSPVTVVEI